MKLSTLLYLTEGFKEQIPFFTKRIYDLYAADVRINDILSWIYKSDPIAVKTNGNKAPFTDQILTWLENGVIRLPEDIETINDTLTKYSHYKNNVGTFPDGEKVKSIDQYKSPGYIREHINVETEGKYDIAKLVMTHGLFKVYEIDNWEIGRICFANSGWCVRHKNTFNSYNPPYFMIIHKNKRYALVHVDSGQIKDVHDNPLSEELATPIIPIILKLFEGQYKNFVVNGEFNAPADGLVFAKYVPNLAKIVLESGDSNLWIAYAAHVIKRRWPEAESHMLDLMKQSTDTDEACIDAWQYALYVIKGRWPEAEPYIMKSRNAYAYARDIIKGRWPEAEPYIMKSRSAYAYARDIIKGRWPEAEPYIYKSGENWAEWYDKLIKNEPSNAEEADQVIDQFL